MEKADTISVVTSHREEMRAQQAEIYLSAMASMLFTGDVALKKCKEVAQLISLLTAAGVKEEEITLRGIQAERNSPIIGRANTATYLLRVCCPDLERLPDILGVTTSQRTVAMDQLVWKFGDDAEMRSQWLANCLAEARRKADQMAAALGVKVLGVHSCNEKWNEPPDDQKRVAFGSGRAPISAKAVGERNGEVGFPLVTTKQLELTIEAEFRVSPYAQ